MLGDGSRWTKLSGSPLGRVQLANGELPSDQEKWAKAGLLGAHQIILSPFKCPHMSSLAPGYSSLGLKKIFFKETVCFVFPSSCTQFINSVFF